MRGSRNVCQGGPGLTVSLDNVFFLLLLSSTYFSLQFTKGVHWVYCREKLYFSKDPEGSDIFQGVQLFPGGGGGLQMLISVVTLITCDFPGGSGPPTPPPPPSGSAHVNERSGHFGLFRSVGISGANCKPIRSVFLERFPVPHKCTRI